VVDAHFHRNGYETFLALDGREVRFFGFHPWQTGTWGNEEFSVKREEVRACLSMDPGVGVGEIGLDRLKTKAVPEAQRTAFGMQLGHAAEFGRPVVLHGAKCWGEVVKACAPYRGRIPAFLFHGFSRSAGLLPEIFALNGFVSVGAALLNDHAVNYREMAKALPLDRVLLESDRDWSAPPPEGDETTQEGLMADLVRKLAELRGVSAEEVAAAVAANAARFTEPRA